MPRGGRKAGWAVCLVFALMSRVLFGTSAFAATVVPSERVQVHVTVKSDPSSAGVPVGVIAVGGSAELLESVPYWHRVRLPDGTEGYVSKAWTDVVADGDPTVEAFDLYFLDVGTGDAAILDIGEVEVIIDGGNSTRVLNEFEEEHDIIDGPVELVVVTHSDADHWKGLTRLLGFDGRVTTPPAVLEFWEPGFDRACAPLDSYDTFLSDMQGLVPPDGFVRPLEAIHAPATAGGEPSPFVVSSVPGVSFTVLHSDDQPTDGDCSYRRNDASIVLMLEVAGVRLLLTGDANGKERTHGPNRVGHVEELLLDVEREHDGTLKADLVKVPHHGSETASTTRFIRAVDPSWVVISASTGHHLPRDTVVERYEDDDRIILRTDAVRTYNNDHIVCSKEAETELSCAYLDTVLED